MNIRRASNGLVDVYHTVKTIIRRLSESYEQFHIENENLPNIYNPLYVANIAIDFFNPNNQRGAVIQTSNYSSKLFKIKPSANETKAKTLNIPAEIIPEEFLDEIMMTVMTHPGELPDHHVCDQSTFETLLKTGRKNPFNRQPITVHD